MKTLNATLNAAQLSLAGRGIARASLADNGKLHLAEVYADAAAGGRTLTISCDTWYQRLRYQSSDTSIYRARVPNPTTESQWETWTLFDAGAAGPQIALFF